MSETPSLTIRENGANALENDSARVQHVDMTKSGILPRIGKIFWPGREGEKPAPQPPAKPIDPAEELATLKNRLAHLESQCAAARKNSENGNSAMIGGDAVGQKRKYVEMLLANLDIAREPWTNSGFLVSILDDGQGNGLIPGTRERIGQLENNLRPTPIPAEEHQRRIAKALKSFKAAGRDYEALRELEADPANHIAGSARYRFRASRPAFGPNFSGLDDRELRRFAEFAALLPDGK